MNNSRHPICPYCLVEVECEEMLGNYEYTTHYESKWRGKCPVCSVTFLWRETYLFDHIEEFKEEIDNG